MVTWLPCHMWSFGDFETHNYVADLQICPKTATFNDLFMTQVLNPPLGEVGGWLGSPSCTPPPHVREFFFFSSFSLITWHLEYSLDVSCPSQSGTSLFILTQPSWDGYLLLYIPKSSVAQIQFIHLQSKVVQYILTKLKKWAKMVVVRVPSWWDVRQQSEIATLCVLCW